MRPLFPALFAMALMASCDYVDRPLGDDDGPSTPPDTGATQVLRRVLLEKYTGHTCTFCPAGETIAEELQDSYGSDRLILMSIHQGVFAEISPPNYTTDFTTADGDAYGAVFQPSAYPQGTIDRVRVNSAYTFSRFAWGTRIAEVIDQPARMEVEISSLQLSGNQINAQVRIIPLQNLGSTNYKLTLALSEDHIIDYQLDGEASPPDVPDYEHNHIFRGTLNGTWGQALSTADLGVGDTLTIDLSGLNVPGNVLVAANCSVVAYVYEQDTYEIMQVNDRVLVP